MGNEPTASMRPGPLRKHQSSLMLALVWSRPKAAWKRVKEALGIKLRILYMFTSTAF